MPAAATGKFTHVGSPHWTSGPLAVIPVGLHDAWKAEFGKRADVDLKRGTYTVDACWGFAGDVRVAKKTESVGISALRLTRARK